TFSDYRQPNGNTGTNQENLLVYGRGGKPCLKCGEALVKTVIAQRGTVYCPVCQS
ncbi:MAG: formamidopyrimidine-DNA glycosylase, partial [Fibrobacteria bacterium]|nr:formamidopyrimidine-DNA glycosylase [Fibrobacteria bacterium]